MRIPLLRYDDRHGKDEEGIGKAGVKVSKKPAGRPSKKESKAKKITGTVFKIVNGKPTKEKLQAETAFGDLEQAREQVLYAERHGSQEEKRLVRLAFRQYQDMRFSHNEVTAPIVES